MKKTKIEGYWYSDDPYNKDYPVPVTDVLTKDDAKAIYDLIIKKQKGARSNAYKGWSTSRITGEHLGSREYETNEWLWPIDFAPHYVLKHRCKPTDEFLDFIGYNDFIDISEL